MTFRRHWIPFAAVSFFILAALLAPILPIADAYKMNMIQRFAPSSFPELFGNDEYGRSVLSRLVWGTRTSLMIAVASAAIACVIGTALGIIAAYIRGAADLIIMRSMDVLLCLPALLLALLFVTIYGPGAGSLIPILALVFVPNFTRVAYSSVLTIRSMEYVEAARAMGAPQWRIMLRTILPNVSAPILVQLSLSTASAVVLESGLSFLGLGVVPPDPSLGMMIGSARTAMMHAPMLLVWPCLVLTLLILTLNAVCDALRDILDPRPSGSSAAK